MAKEDTCSSVSRSATHFLTGTFISRFTGMIRDMSMAYCFGTSVAVAAFLVAFRLANLLRRLFGEGALLNGFIPYFELFRKDSAQRGAFFFRDLFLSLAAFLSIMVLFLEVVLFAFWTSPYIGENARHILHMTMLMLPGLVFICLFGLTTALLECEKNFFTPGIAPVAFNIVWITAVWFFYKLPPYEAMAYISYAIVIAFFLQWLVTMPGVVRYLREHLTLKDWLGARLFAPELSQMVSPLLLGVVGVAAVQVNSAVDVVIARFSTLSGPAYLSYAHRLQQLPLALFGIAISSAIMPPLARAIKGENRNRYLELMHFGMTRTFSFLMPTTVAIFVLGAASVNLLYGRGHFDQMSTVQTTLCLWGYGIGLIPAAFVLLLAPAFYAKNDFWTPTKGSLLAVGTNTFLNILFIFGLNLGPLSIALATSASALLNMWYLLSKETIFSIKPLLNSFGKTAVAAVSAGVIVLCLGHFLCRDPSWSIFLARQNMPFARHIHYQVLQFILLTASYGVLFFSFSFLIKAEGVMEMLNFLKQFSFVRRQRGS